MSGGVYVAGHKHACTCLLGQVTCYNGNKQRTCDSPKGHATVKVAQNCSCMASLEKF